MANTVTDDLYAALLAVVPALTKGTIADMQMEYISRFTGVSGGTFTDKLVSLGMEPTVLLPVPLPPVV